MADATYMQTTPAGRHWTLVQLAAVTAGAALIAALLAAPETGLHLLWDVAVPLLPLLFVIAPGAWRNACPLASLSLLPSRTGLSRRRPLSRKWQTRLLGSGIVLLLLILPLRPLLLDHSGVATALLFGGFAIAALGLGFVFDLKSAWCSGLCPLHPIELLYGSRPQVVVRNAQCRACSGCTATCRDSTAGVSPLNANCSKIMPTLLVGGFPGFVLGWFLVRLQPGWSTGFAVLVAYGLPVVGMLATLALYLLVSRVRRGGAPRFFAFLALAIFYWFKLPDLIGLQSSPAHALFSLRGVLPEWSVWPLRAAVIGVLAALMLRNGHVKAWSFRPQPERRSLHR